MKLMNFHITTDENGRVLATVNAEVGSFAEGQHLLATVLGQHTVSEAQAVAGPRASGAASAPAARATPSAPPAEVPSYKGITDRDALKKLAMERGLVDASNRSGAAAFVQMLEAHDRMQASQRLRAQGGSHPPAAPTAKQLELVRRIRNHAQQYYEVADWDILVETWTDDDILNAIGRSRTFKSALYKVHAKVLLQAERRSKS